MHKKTRKHTAFTEKYRSKTPKKQETARMQGIDFFSRWAEKVAQWAGEQAQSVQKAPPAAALNRVFEQYPLSSLLPYETFDPDTQLFYNKKSRGFMHEVSPLTGASEQTVQVLAHFLTDGLPPKLDLQILLWASPQVGEVVDAFVAARSQKDDVFAWLAQQRALFLKSSKRLACDGPFVLRDFKVYVVGSLSHKAGQDTVGKLLRTREALVSALASVPLPGRPVDMDAFMGLMHGLLAPSRSLYPTQQRWSPWDALSPQLTDPEYQVRVFPGHLSVSSAVEAWEVRCLAVKDFPPTAHLGEMHQALGQLFNAANQVPCPFVLSVHLRAEDAEKSTALAQAQVLNKDTTAKSQLAKFKPTLAKEHRDWTFVRDRLSEGDRLVKLFYQVVLYAPPSQADESETLVKTLYKGNGWKLRKPAFLQLQSWLAMCPMMMSEGMFEDLKGFGRLRTLNAFAAVNLLPLVAEWKGGQRPSLLLPGRRGQVAVWDPFDNPGGNYNVAIAAASGSGKSAFTQEYLVAMVGSGGRVWAIDVGRSYEKTCRTLGGEFVEFRPDSVICINPFTAIQHFEESLELLKPLAAAMARPTGVVSDEELAWLEKALKAAWEQKGNQATMTNVSAWLAAQDNDVCQRLAHLLFTYTVDGMYGRYFEGACSLDFTNPFVVLELEELKAKKDLQKIVLFVLMYQISERMYLGDRTQRKSCVIDEAWDLLGGENTGAASFIETGYRRARRYNANFVTVTQSINDYFKNATSIAAYENSSFKVILRQEAESIHQLVASGRLELDAYGLALLKSLKTTPDYAECMIKSGQGISVHRIIFDPYSRILYSSKGEEFEAVKALQAQGLSLVDAISRVAAQRFS